MKKGEIRLVKKRTTSNQIWERHLKELRDSGISLKTAIKNGVRSVNGKEARKLLKRRRDIGAGLLFPYPYKGRFLEGVFNFKPDMPLPAREKGKKPRKYVRPIGQGCRLYAPKAVWEVIRNLGVDLFITEGEKKSLKGTQEGFPTIAVSGVFNWVKKGGEPIEDFEWILLKDRTVYLVFDSDKFTNKLVLLAEQRLAEFLISKGALVKIINLKGDEK